MAERDQELLENSSGDTGASLTCTDRGLYLSIAVLPLVNVPQLPRALSGQPYCHQEAHSTVILERFWGFLFLLS